jgi:hypothetical protein
LSRQAKESTASQWFRANEAGGNFMGIRYGRIPHQSDQVEWSFVSHCECDGIGGFVRILRERGFAPSNLPSSNHPSRSAITSLWNLWNDRAGDHVCALRTDWKRQEAPTSAPSQAVAWHVFQESETHAIRENARRLKVTVNSLLLKHLDHAIRPEVRGTAPKIPWVIPVNMRGLVRLHDDTENHVSCVDVLVAADDTPANIHRQILRRLERGEHQANYLLLGLGRFLSHGTKVKILAKARSKPAGNIGSFSNLGVWDSQKNMETNDSWLFCPPVVRGQLLGAGCVTFQNRLGLALQGHPGTPPDPVRRWMDRWIGGILH